MEQPLARHRSALRQTQYGKIYSVSVVQGTYAVFLTVFKPGQKLGQKESLPLRWSRPAPLLRGDPRNAPTRVECGPEIDGRGWKEGLRRHRRGTAMLGKTTQLGART